MILTIKWHFDYLAKTRRDPDELNLSIRFWFNILSIFKDFEKLGWINLQNRKKKLQMFGLILEEHLISCGLKIPQKKNIMLLK